MIDLIRGIAFQSTPSAWRETISSYSPNTGTIFQSTPSAWRETQMPPSRCSPYLYFNPLPPHGGRRGHRRLPLVLRYFNPLPPHGGRLTSTHRSPRGYLISIHSLRMEGDGLLDVKIDRILISIHSLRMEGDVFALSQGLPVWYFNPLPPHGGRRHGTAYRKQRGKFQSTPSAWRET